MIYYFNKDSHIICHTANVFGQLVCEELFSALSIQPKNIKSAEFKMEKFYSMESDYKVLVVSPEPFYENRGTPIAILHMLKALSELGKKVDLVTYHLGEDIELPGLNIYRSYPLFGIRHVPIGFSIRKILLDIALILMLIKRLRKAHYDCIHAVEEMAFPAVILGYWYKIPVIYDMQSSLPEQMSQQYAFFRQTIVKKLLRWFERWLIQSSSRVVCSIGLKQYIENANPDVRVREWRFPGQHTEVSDDEIQRLRNHHQLTRRKRVVLYSGNFNYYQGVNALVEAVPKVLSVVPNVIFLFVGLDSHSERIWAEKIVARYGKAHFRILPRQRREIAIKLLSLADVLVSPRTDNSNLPLKIFDYLAAGKPIVATDITSHRLVLDDDCAMFFNPSDANELAKRIIFLLQDHNHARKISHAARCRADEICSWRIFTEQVAGLHDQRSMMDDNCLSRSPMTWQGAPSDDIESL